MKGKRRPPGPGRPGSERHDSGPQRAPRRPARGAAPRLRAGEGYFATCPRAVEPLLAAELESLGASDVVARRAGVSFAGPLEIAYRACLWSRLASRILVPLASFSCRSENDLYEGVRRIPWLDHLSERGTLAVEFTGVNARITHTHFGALKTKDAIVDSIRERAGQRPDVSVRRPDVQVNVHLADDRATVAIDLSGESLHRRGYRQSGGGAPLKENLAAAILALTDWARLAASGAPFVDPMCGSGTLPIEAALIAADVAPGLLRNYFGFLGWRGHEARTWQRLLDEAVERRAARRRLPAIHGYDHDASAVRTAIGNVERAGLRGAVHVEKRAFSDSQPLASSRAEPPLGLLVVNPPYGERLGEQAELRELYPLIGDVLRRRFTGWTGCVFTGNPELAATIGLRPRRRHVLFNGAIECRLLEFPISLQAVQGEGPGWREKSKDEG